tara:strand:- start:7 stop:240 length:234 start_codon:yes stop_codon:yes gene_type:complete
MKGKRLVDVLGEEVNDNSTILTKFILLLQRMEATNPNIDNSELRWVENRIDRLKDGEILTKNDLLTANLYWKKWENN